MQAWIPDELQTVALGDTRRDARLAQILDDLSQRPSASIPVACRGGQEMDAAYEFFANPNVTDQDALAPHYDATVQRVREHPVVLAVQDTSELDLTRPQEKVGGPLNDEHHYGLYLHPLVAFTPDRVPLGVLHAHIWHRDPKHFRQKSKRKQRALTDKESRRWLQGYQHACATAEAAPETEIICLADSEGDIYEILLAAQPEHECRQARFIMRACQNRVVVPDADDDTADGTPKLFAAVAATAVLERCTVRVSRRVASPSETRKRKKARAERDAVVTIQAARVTLRGPKRPGGRLANLEVNAVLVREENPPAGAEPVEWLLLTDLPINSTAAVLQVVEYYCVRWGIEIFFFVLKQGCKIEQRQLETTERFRVCLAVYLIVAWRVMFVTLLGRQEPEAPCEVLFDESEWRALFTLLRGAAPAEMPTLGEVIGLVAELGGYTGRPTAGPPGPKVMWLGLQRLMDIAACWRAFGPKPAQSPANNGHSKLPP